MRWRLALRRAVSGPQLSGRETKRSGAQNYQKRLWGGWRFGIACVVLMQMRGRERTCSKYSWGLAASVLIHYSRELSGGSRCRPALPQVPWNEQCDLTHGAAAGTHTKKLVPNTNGRQVWCVCYVRFRGHVVQHWRATTLGLVCFSKFTLLLFLPNCFKKTRLCPGHVFVVSLKCVFAFDIHESVI